MVVRGNPAKHWQAGPRTRVAGDQFFPSSTTPSSAMLGLPSRSAMAFHVKQLVSAASSSRLKSTLVDTSQHATAPPPSIKPTTRTRTRLRMIATYVLELIVSSEISSVPSRTYFGFLRTGLAILCDILSSKTEYGTFSTGPVRVFTSRWDSTFHLNCFNSLTHASEATFC